MTQIEIDRRVFELYDEYCHGRLDRREFPQTISFTDTRIKAQYLTYPSPGGGSGQ